ncbi:MAG: VWA domain-containing protein [Myxococcales bacterium]|nr:VWA domain-containing protein [Myxococcales bacterium]
MSVGVGEGDRGSTASGLSARGGHAVPLLGVAVSAEVVGGHARAKVRQRYRNDEAHPIEAIYTFPLPTRAVLTGFSMTVEGRRLEGVVQEREQAFRSYDDAITAGHGAALLEQERPNVFTANVGNLLPGEETILEVEYVEPVRAEEGAVRWSVPTLVAPRYVPGAPKGDRTAHGTADPTDRVPDADRISPPIGAVAYGLSLDLVFDLGVAVDVESPSHAVVVQGQGNKTRVTFSQREVPLDRDVVVTASPRDGEGLGVLTPIASVLAHKSPGSPGAVAITIVPDLAAGSSKRGARSDVVFVLDRSGSMGGSSMQEARTALRLCLRQLREGDRFNVLAFDTEIEAFAAEMVPFTHATLQRADAWLSRVDARGGTEMLTPLLEAARLAPDGVVVLLTDGEVGNEEEIAQAFVSARRTARVYSFGIGTNVSDALLEDLAARTGGAVELIHPGERIDDKVVAQFARATAPHVKDLTIKLRGVDIGEMAPATPDALVDSEPLCLFGTYEEPGRGAIEVRGTLDGEAFYLEVPVDLPAESDRPVIAKLWAQARIRDLERAPVSGRRGEAMRDRIVRLAVEHGVSSKLTSFVVVEKRVGDRRTAEHAETRVVPVSPPAGWEMFSIVGAANRGGAPPIMMRYASAPPPPPAMAPAPARPMAMRSLARAAPMAPMGGAPPKARKEAAYDDTDEDDMTLASHGAASFGEGGPADLFAERARSQGLAEPTDTLAEADGVRALLSRQSASGLWDEPGVDTLLTTARALAALVAMDLSTSHPVHGAQIKKAVEALLELLEHSPTVDAAAAALAISAAWLLATGRRTRTAVERWAGGRAPGLSLEHEDAVRAYVREALAAHTETASA